MREGKPYVQGCYIRLWCSKKSMAKTTHCSLQKQCKLAAQMLLHTLLACCTSHHCMTALSWQGQVHVGVTYTHSL